jgi:hypothetical protein
VSSYYSKREQAEREKWTKKINEDMRNNPNLIWKSSWGGAPWYDTRDPHQKWLGNAAWLVVAGVVIVGVSITALGVIGAVAAVILRSFVGGS